MKTNNVQVIKETDTLPLTTAPYSLSEVSMFAIQLKLLSGSVAVKLQASCDKGTVSAGGAVSEVSLWTDVLGSEKILSGGDDLMYDFVDNGYSWLRIIVIGTGSLIARINTKGV